MAETRTLIFELPQYSAEASDGFSMADWNEMVTNVEGRAALRTMSGLRNVLRNPNFDVWQRGAGPFAGSSGGVFSADGWRASLVGGASAVNRVAMGAADVSGARYGISVATSGQAGVGDLSSLTTQIENVRRFSGTEVTVSFWAKAASGTPKVGVSFGQSFGTGGAPSGGVTTPAGTVTLSTSWARYEKTVIIPSIAGKTLGTNGDDNIGLTLWLSAGSTYNTASSTTGIQNNTISFAQVQLETGEVATPFEQRDPTLDWLICQRFYVRRWGDASGSLPAFTGGVITATNACNIPYEYPVPMRSIPTVNGSGVAQVYDGTSVSATNAAIQINAANTQQAVLTFICGTSPFVVGRACYVIVNGANSYIELVAELP